MKTAHTLAILILPALAIVAFAPRAAEASFSISYSSGDWSYHGHKHHKHYKHRKHQKHHKYKHPKHAHRYSYKSHKKHAHRKYAHRHYGYSYPRYAAPYHYRTRWHRRLYDLPRGAKFVWVDGRKYYTYRGSYYRRSDCGTYYITVENPHPRYVRKKEEVHHYYDDHVYESNQKEFVVHIRDKKGDLVTVRLTKESDGYVGPQGEYYPDFPKVAQLREMYLD